MNSSKSFKDEAYDQQKLLFPSDLDLLDELVQRTDKWTGKTVILAGHFMLAYRESEQRLVEVLQAFHDEASVYEKDLLSYRVGDFPEASLRLAIQLISSQAATTEMKVALLVNDYDFGRRQELPIEPDVPANLRREYFRTHTEVPAPLLEIAAAYGKNEHIFERNDSVRSKGTLPSQTMLFSESALRNRFERTTCNRLADLPGVRVTGTAYRTRQIVWLRQDNQQEFCLVDEAAGCACSGASVELLTLLSARGAHNLILFMPDDCYLPMRASIRGTLFSGFLKFQNVMVVAATPPGVDAHVRFCQAEVFHFRG